MAFLITGTPPLLCNGVWLVIRLVLGYITPDVRIGRRCKGPAAKGRVQVIGVGNIQQLSECSFSSIKWRRARRLKVVVVNVYLAGDCAFRKVAPLFSVLRPQ